MKNSNCNSAMGPKESLIALAVILDLYGVPFNEILKRLLLNTMRDATGRELLPVFEGNETNQ